MKIKTKIFLSFFITGLTIIIVSIFFTYNITSKSLRQKIDNTLETTTHSRAQAVNQFLEEQKNKIKIAATHQELSNEELKKIVKTNSEFYELFTLDSQGIIIASSNELNIGLDRSTDDYFINAQDKTYIKNIYLPKTTNIHFITVATPHTEGVLVARIKLDHLEEITKDKTGLEETGESYLINKDKYMITSSRFIQDNFLKQKVNTMGSNYCFQQQDNQQHNIVQQYADYRNIQVIGSHIYIPEMQWCLLAEIDVREALKSLQDLQIFFAILGFSFLIIIIFISIAISNSISNPIKSLQHGSEIIAKGNLDHKVATNKKDEIGELSRAFDQMTLAIKQSRAQVDQKVEDQTKDIRQKSINLQKQKIAILNILEDVQQESNKTARERDKINTILQSIGDAVFVVNKDLKIILFNQIAADISGYSIKEALGQPYDKILKFVFEKDSKTNDKFISQAIATGQIKEMGNHTVLIKKDGTKIPVADSAAPLMNKNKQVIGCVIVFRDITRERQIDRMKTEFISLASHQLRTPLSAMKWFLEMLLNGDAGELTTEQKEYITNVDQSNERMIALVNALLNISRIESGRIIIESQPTDLPKLIEEIVTEIKPKIDQKKQILTIDINKNIPLVNLDPKLVRHIYLNLLTNANKYTPEAGKISLNISFNRETIVSQVTDSGLGIPIKEQKKVFAKFFRGENIVKTETDGTGLGLYLAKLITNASGGKIWFESVENKGTTFWFTLPLKGVKSKKGEVSLT